MINYIYDGTFEGLLTVLMEALIFYPEVDEITTTENTQPGLFDEIKIITTDPEKADYFFKKLTAQCSEVDIHNIGYCYLSEEPGMERAILDYIHLLFKGEYYETQNFTDNRVQRIQRINDKVSHEMHRMHGFIRFRKLKNGIYYAPISPDHNIIQLLAPHFSDRFADQSWLIHDTKRDTGIYYDLKICRFIPYVEMSNGIVSACQPFSSGIQTNTEFFAVEETDYQEIWDNYFQKIAIPERVNKKLQKQRMPQRYWQYLVEKVK